MSGDPLVVGDPDAFAGGKRSLAGGNRALADGGATVRGFTLLAARYALFPTRV
jgi:hypothetical protein